MMANPSCRLNRVDQICSFLPPSHRAIMSAPHVMNGETMTEFAAELNRRITSARESLRAAQAADDLDAERVYAGELDSLLHLATENGVDVQPDTAR